MTWWIRKQTNEEPLAVSLSSIKLGDRLLIVGSTDVPLIVALATKAGLTGRTCMVDDRDAVTRHAAVEREGVLVEPFEAPFSALPFEADSFDVAVLRGVLKGLDAPKQSQLAAEAFRVLRPGGRCAVIEDERRGGLAGLLTGGGAPGPSSSSRSYLEAVLSGAGFRGVRTIAERARVLFLEGVKAGVTG
jgi:ubiquinone/menaquinone biosynthesis C-methylase UbiE